MPKKKKSEIDDSKIKIIHKMADGTIRDSVDGYVIPYNKETAIVYHLLVKWAYEKQQQENINYTKEKGDDKQEN